MDATIADLKQRFTAAFGEGGKIHVIRAPGRVNLIGEHVDYSDGFVLPMAIEPQVMVVCRGRDDGRVGLRSTAYPNDVVEFSIEKKIDSGKPKWANYSKGVAAELIGAGIPLNGMDALIGNTLPVGGGLSSSAAIMVGTTLSFLTIAGLKLSPERLALICQKAEHEYAGMPSGIMDMTIVAGAKAGHATLLDCRDNAKTHVAIDPKELTAVVVDTLVPHDLAEGEYRKRREQCEEGVAIFRKLDPSIKALRDVTLKQLEDAKTSLGDLIYRRCRHGISEIARTTQAATLLAKRRYEEVGELMAQSHHSLQHDYEVSIPQLDFLAEEARKFKGVYGARMTGGGFGGCIIALVQPRAAEALGKHLSDLYRAKFNTTPTVLITSAAPGASVIE